MQDLLNFFTSLKSYGWWRVAIEMLVIGLVVYWVLRFLRASMKDKRGARVFDAHAAFERILPTLKWRYVPLT